MLVERDTGVPCEVALRWTVLDRRGRVAVSTIADDLYAVQRVYEWADRALEVPIDTHLTEWQGFSARQVYSLAQWVKTNGKLSVSGSIGGAQAVLSPSAFNAYWRRIEAFLRWTAEMYARGEGDRQAQQLARSEARERVQRSFRQHHVREALAPPVRVLTAEEWEKVRSSVDVEREDVWPDPRARFRNHAMVHLAYHTGLRIGELLKLSIDQTPRGAECHITVKRRPDDPHDPRTYEPQVKTSEREIPIPPFVRELLGAYVTQHRPRSLSPYVFVAQSGQPLSLRGARHVVERISCVSGIHVTWHRFRHTFFDRVYQDIADRPDGTDLLMELGGWSAPSSVQPYVRRALQQKAEEVLADYQQRLLPSVESDAPAVAEKAGGGG